MFRRGRDAWNTGTATWYIHDSSRADANPFVISDMVLDDATDVHVLLSIGAGMVAAMSNAALPLDVLSKSDAAVVENCEKNNCNWTAGIAPTISEL